MPLVVATSNVEDHSTATPSSTAISAPTGTAAGDILVMTAAADFRGTASLGMGVTGGWNTVTVDHTTPVGVLQAGVGLGMWWKIADSGDVGATYTVSFGSSYLFAVANRTVAVYRLTGTSFGACGQMVDYRNTVSPSATWQPSTLPAAALEATLLMFEAHTFTNAGSPLVTANGWSVEYPSYIGNGAAFVSFENCATLPAASPVFIATPSTRLAIGLALATVPLELVPQGVFVGPSVWIP